MSTLTLNEVEILLNWYYFDNMKNIASTGDRNAFQTMYKNLTYLAYDHFKKLSTEELLIGFKDGFSKEIYSDVAKKVLVERNFNLNNLIFL